MPVLRCPLQLELYQNVTYCQCFISNFGELIITMSINIYENTLAISD